MNNTILLKALVGSHNYNLNDEDSDRDYKQFILPTFDNLYNYKSVSSAVIKQNSNLDIETKDIRHLITLLKKANPSYIEILFSVEVEVHPLFETIWQMLQHYREDLVRHNLVSFVNASVGMMYQKHSNFEKCTASTQHLCDKFGYDTKNYCHLIRICYLLQDYFIDGFSNYADKLTVRHEELLKIKHGDVPHKIAVAVAKDFIDLANKMKNLYVKDRCDQTRLAMIFSAVDNEIRLLVKNNLY